jgi:hypothetical protein
MATEVVMFVFPTRGALVDATETIRSNAHVKVHKSALLARAEDNEVVALDDDLSPVEGAITGGTLGSLMGALGIAGLGAVLLPGIGPILAIGAGALAGGALGGLIGGGTAGALDMGVNNKLLDAAAAHLQANQVAVVLEVEGDAAGLSQLEAQLAPHQATFVRLSEA